MKLLHSYKMTQLYMIRTKQKGGITITDHDATSSDKEINDKEYQMKSYSVITLHNKESNNLSVQQH